jgi:hypothetical protein
MTKNAISPDILREEDFKDLKEILEKIYPKESMYKRIGTHIEVEIPDYVALNAHWHYWLYEIIFPTLYPSKLRRGLILLYTQCFNISFIHFIKNKTYRDYD